MRRREFIGIVGGAAGWPLAAWAQQPQRVRRIGAMMNRAAGDPDITDSIAAFSQGLGELGWSIGGNVRIEYRFGAGDVDVARKTAAELIALAPDIILASGTVAVAALQQLSPSIPVVFTVVTDNVMRRKRTSPENAARERGGLRKRCVCGSADRHQVPGFKVVILDAKGRERPTDERGEIVIDTEKSPLHWFDGYYSESEGTTVRYPFGRRYYLTGDFGRMDAQGNVYYLGTKEDAINNSGYLIVPGQIEAALASHPAVAEAAIVGKPDRLRGEVIKAFVVLKSKRISSPDVAEDIAQHVRGRLPPYSLPPEIEFVARLPRTFGGKLYRRTSRDRRTGNSSSAKK